MIETVERTTALREVVYPTAIGPVTLRSNWEALHLLFQKRCGWTRPGPKAVDVIVSRMNPEAVSTLDVGQLKAMDALIEYDRSCIRAAVPDPSFCAGIILDWLWLALAQFCAPEGWQFLHAAAVENGEGITLIAGPSGAGKSTTLLAHLDEGARFISDDAVLVNRETGEVRPWTPDLHLSVETMQERWPDLLPATVDFNGKVRMAPQALGYAASEGGKLARTILLADEGTPFSLRHKGIGLENADDTSGPDVEMLRALAPVEFWGWRPADMKTRVIAAYAPACPELAVCTLFSGKGWALDRWLDSFLALSLPGNAFILWLCNSSDDLFWTQLQEAAEAIRGQYPGLVLWRDTHRIGIKDRQVAYLYQQLRTRIPEECEAIFLLEDDVLPPPESFDRMLREYLRRGGDDIIGLPVPHTYWQGETTYLAWDYYPSGNPPLVAPETGVREARRANRPGEVGGISFSCALVPRTLIDQASFSPGVADMPASGYDHIFCLESRTRGAKVVAMWGLDAIHMKEDRRGLEVKAIPRAVLVLGASEAISGGPGWEVVDRQPSDLLAARIGRTEAEFALLVDPAVLVTPTYVDACIEDLTWHTSRAVTWGFREMTDGRMELGNGPGAMIRVAACREAKGETFDELRAWLAAEGWKEGHHTRAHYHWREDRAAGYKATFCHERAKSPYLALWLNRDPYRGPHPGFGGDLVQIAGYRKGLRNLGVWSDLRPTAFSEFDGYDLIHANHVQFPWAWPVAENREQYRSIFRGRIGLVVHTITHGRPSREVLRPVVEFADLLLCYSESEAAFYEEQFPHVRGRTRVIPMGVAAELYSISPPVERGDPSVFMAGKYCDLKNQLSVLRACKMLDVPVTFAGFNEDPQGDPYRPRLEAEAAGYSKARVLGRLTGQDLWNEYRRAHVHVCASLFGPYEQVSDDALALRCNIVHTRNSWAAEQFGRVGSLCDPKDEANIARAIETELARPRGWANQRPPTHTEAARSLLPVYEEVLGR